MVTMSHMPQAPDGLPRLSRGTHSGPQAGACFMEYVSLLAGEPWSDQPRCTHPLLGEVARTVNDAMSQAGRDRLVPLLPSVIGKVSDDPRTSPRLVDELITTAVSLGVDDGLLLRSHQRRARRRLRRLGASGHRTRTGRLGGLSDFAYREGPAVRAIDAVARAVGRLPTDRKDDALLALLTAAIDVLPPAPSEGPARVYSVSSDLRRPD